MSQAETPNDEKETLSPEEAVEQTVEATANQEDTAAATEGAEVSIDALQAQIAGLQESLSQAQEKALRAQAEEQNARRRAEQEVSKARKFALEKFVSDMLPVADNMERAIESLRQAEEDNAESMKSLLEGVELTHKTLLDALKRHSVEAVNPEGEPFDPQLHQAMSMVPNPDAEPNTVLNVFQKGYTLNGRLVRPAMVVVSKAAE